VAPVGVFFLTVSSMSVFKKWQQSSFLLLWALVSYYFCLKMSRLIILAGGITSALCGVVFGFLLDFAWGQIYVSPYKTISNNRIIENIRRAYYKHQIVYIVRLLLLALVVYTALSHSHHITDFQNHCNSISASVSEPRIMFRHQFEGGRYEIIDDYRQAYFWLKKTTPASARVMSWWDYGYQITGMNIV
jgi:dolichyl-diphosphooligosaccharide--protein glycosyltransferase